MQTHSIRERIIDTFSLEHRLSEWGLGFRDVLVPLSCFILKETGKAIRSDSQSSTRGGLECLTAQPLVREPGLECWQPAPGP